MLFHLLSKNRIKLKQYKDLLGFYPGDLSLYSKAAIHKSASVRTKNNRVLNNERLEFLGDAILDAIVAEYLFLRFRDKKEGFLTKLRARIVSREMLNEIAEKLKLDKFIKSQVQSSEMKNIYGNALEALIGAIYLDQGYKTTKKFVISRIINQHINIEELQEMNLDYKSQIIEWAQKNKKDIQFEDSETPSASNGPNFHAEVILDNKLLGNGNGTSKKEAQQNASKMAINVISKTF